MRWGDMRRSDNVEDVTGGQPSGGGVPFGGGMKLGGGAMILIVIVSLLFWRQSAAVPGHDGRRRAGPGAGPCSAVRAAGLRSSGSGPESRGKIRTKRFPPTCWATPRKSGRRCSRRWDALRATQGSSFPQVHRVDVRSGERSLRASICAADRKLYLDTAFFQELKTASARPVISPRRT